MVGGNRVDTIIITNSLPHLWKHFAAAAAAVAIECLTFVKNKQNVKILVSIYVFLSAIRLYTNHSLSELRKEELLFMFHERNPFELGYDEQ